MDVEVPAVVDREELLTAEWLTSALRAGGHDVTVISVEREAVGTGQMGSSFRCSVTYDGEADGLPASFVAKLPATEIFRRQLAAGIYRTEVSFYRDLAPTVDVRTPLCHHSGLSDDWNEFVLLLEDLAPAVQGDQLAGCSPEQARSAIVNLAALHGPRWCDPTLNDLEWVTPVDDEGIAMLTMVSDLATGMFVEMYGDRLSEEDIALLRDVPPRLGAWMTGRTERFGPLHGDYRLDNLMFGVDGSVATVDWQTAGVGLPARDLAYFLSTSLLPDDRRAHERELVAGYHEALVAMGVDGYDLGTCWDDYRFGMIQGPLITIVGAAYGERTDRGDEMFLAMATRACDAIRDLGTFDLVG